MAGMVSGEARNLLGSRGAGVGWSVMPDSLAPLPASCTCSPAQSRWPLRTPTGCRQGGEAALRPEREHGAACSL